MDSGLGLRRGADQVWAGAVGRSSATPRRSPRATES